ncbi:unnamed protein product [Callosobruchus maculatus]|uniref:RRM domain-containing protein n=1 Tax=Callosobruchus maculatus TaxID=64391 RepID=A0A653DAN2_CALMS|nr:unnamed protein product [Callosobruchus maculatus]
MDILDLNKITAAAKKASQKQSAKMKISKVGNQTNSQDPQAVNSRVFVGNLNTFQCSKTDVERMFQRYGRLAGISMHKGYAFVQFTNPFDARSACLGEDGRTVLSQILASKTRIKDQDEGLPKSYFSYAFLCIEV